MRSFSCLGVLLLGLCLALASLLVLGSAGAEDPPAASGNAPTLDGPPPELARGKDAYLRPVDRPDLIEYLGALRQQITQFETPPPSNEDVTVLRDAWSAILKPRIRRMVKRMEKWEQPKRWIWAEGESGPVSLKPEQWTTFTRDMAALGTELHGAWTQYGKVKIKAKRLAAGYPTPAPRYPYPSYAYPYSRLYGGIVDRQAAGAVLGRYSSNSYWHLMNRYRYAWDWSYVRRLQRYQNYQKRVTATKDLFSDLKGEIQATRDTLGQAILGLQVFIAALQNAEEERLLGLCESCRTGDETLKKMGVTALDAMRDSRLAAERYQGKSSAAYGTLLRKWLRAEKAALKVMEIAHDQGEFDEPAEDAADDGDQK